MSYIPVGARIRLQNVVLATDFSAALIARNYQGKLYVLHVISPEVYWVGTTGEYSQDQGGHRAVGSGANGRSPRI
jgi:hypothetical protein